MYCLSNVHCRLPAVAAISPSSPKATPAPSSEASASSETASKATPAAPVAAWERVLAALIFRLSAQEPAPKLAALFEPGVQVDLENLVVQFGAVEVLHGVPR